jgi:hypothetical protein
MFNLTVHEFSKSWISLFLASKATNFFFETQEVVNKVTNANANTILFMRVYFFTKLNKKQLL